MTVGEAPSQLPHRWRERQTHAVRASERAAREGDRETSAACEQGAQVYAQCAAELEAALAGAGAAVEPDLLRAGLRVLVFISPWHVAHALSYPESIGAQHDELHTSGAEIQAHAREALSRLFPEEATASE